MRLIRRQEAWDPFREMELLSDRMNRLFGAGNGNGEHEALATTDWAPSCDISETDKEYRVHAELPNVKREDVRVTVDGGVLTIEGERREEMENKEEKDVKFHRRELFYGNFMRRFALPDDADESRVHATFKDGMLNVVIAKAKAKQDKAQVISVH